MTSSRRRITPACAGNSKRSEKRVETHRDHPRLRGEQPSSVVCKAFCMGSPPLARGTVFDAVVGDRDIGITPACAGNRKKQLLRLAAERDHPRLRGEQTKKRLVVSCILQYRFSFFNQFFVDMFC